MSFFALIVIGAFAGWVAGQFMQGHAFGLLADIGVGIIGAFIGGYLLGSIGDGLGRGEGIIGRVIVAFLGALILLFALRLFTGRRRRMSS